MRSRRGSDRSYREIPPSTGGISRHLRPTHAGRACPHARAPCCASPPRSRRGERGGGLALGVGWKLLPFLQEKGGYLLARELEVELDAEDWTVAEGLVRPSPTLGEALRARGEVPGVGVPLDAEEAPAAPEARLPSAGSAAPSAVRTISLKPNSGAGLRYMAAPRARARSWLPRQISRTGFPTASQASRYPSSRRSQGCRASS
jgi:hypothetical protein